MNPSIRGVPPQEWVYAADKAARVSAGPPARNRPGGSEDYEEPQEARRDRRRCRRARGRLRRCVDGIRRRRDLSGRRSVSPLPVREEGDDLSPDGVEEEPVQNDPGLAERREGSPEARRCPRALRVGRLHDVPQDQERKEADRQGQGRPKGRARDEAWGQAREVQGDEGQEGRQGQAEGQEEGQAQAQGLETRKSPAAA